MYWNLYHNGTLISSALLSPSDPYNSANPYDFANGSGGPSVLLRNVSKGI